MNASDVKAKKVIGDLVGLFRNLGGGWIDDDEYCDHLPGCATLYHDKGCKLYPLIVAIDYIDEISNGTLSIEEEQGENVKE